jgi:hypothetical protein
VTLPLSYSRLLLPTAAPKRQKCAHCKTSNHGHRYHSNRSVSQRAPYRKFQYGKQKHREKETAHALSPLITTHPNLNNGAQGRIRTSVARKERQIYSLLPLTTRPPVRNSAAHFAFHDQPHNKNSWAHRNALHSPLDKIDCYSCVKIAVRAGRDSEVPLPVKFGAGEGI